MLIAGDIHAALSPALIGERVGLELDGWQAELLNKRPKRALLLCSRQSGKSTVCALMALHQATYKPGSLTIIVSPSQRQSAEMFRTIMQFRTILGVPLKSESVLRAEFENASRILALPGSQRTVRGYAGANLVIIDEACRVEDELLSAVRPMMATTHGSLVALSTPAGKRGWFFEAWTGGDDTWHRIKVTAADCPRISKEFLADELRSLGAQRFSEEYGLEFLENDESVFPSAIIDAAFSHEVLPLWP